MAVTWALTAEQIVDDACYMLGLAPLGSATKAVHRAKGLQILNGVLKSMPWYGALWPSTTESLYPLALQPGGGPIALPANYLSSPIFQVGIDAFRAGFNLEDSALSPGPLDTGQEWTAVGGVFGRSGGCLYLTTATPSSAILVDTGFSDGEIGVTLSISTGANYPVVVFRLDEDTDTAFSFGNTAGSYSIYYGVTLVKTYATPVPADDDIISVRYIGPSIIPIVNGVELEAYQSIANLTSTVAGIGCSGTTARFKNFYWTNGETRLLEIVTSGAWAEIPNKFNTADYPTKAYIDPANRLHVWPLPNYFTRGLLQYQSQLADLVAGASPDMTSDFHPILSNMVGDKLSLFTGRRVLGKDCERRWKEELPLAIAAHNDQGDVIGDYDE